MLSPRSTVAVQAVSVAGLSSEPEETEPPTMKCAVVRSSELPATGSKYLGRKRTAIPQKYYRRDV